MSSCVTFTCSSLSISQVEIAMMSDGRRGRFDVVLVWASDRIARSVKHFLDVLDELNRLNIEFISFREQIDTGGPLGRAVVVIIGAIAELERNLIIERVRAGMRRTKLEGRHIGGKPLVLDRNAILQDRQRGHSLSQFAKSHLVSRATIHRVLKEHASTPWRSPLEGKHRLDPDIHAACRCLRLHDWLGHWRTGLPLQKRRGEGR
jgi:DNA invertase Pin-like site-specific DNA recombinase